MGRNFFLPGATPVATGRWAAMAIVGGLLLAAAAVLRAGSLSALSPAGASVGLTVAITGTGINATASSNQVTFTQSGRAPVSAVASSVATLDAKTGLRRLLVVVPSGLAVGAAAVQVKNISTGETSQGKTLQILELQLPGANSAPAGANSVAVRIAGSGNCQFMANGTRVSLGADVTVTSTLVESATSLLVTATVSPSASPGARTVAVMTGSQNAQLVGGFLVTPSNGRPTSNPGGPYTGVAGAPLSFDGSHSSDPDQDALTYLWDFGDGATGTGMSPAHAYTASGVYTVSLSVDDHRGGVHAGSTTATIARPNHPPVADPGGPYSGTAGQPIAFTGSSSADMDGDPLTYAWDFGDGTTGSGAAPSHVYGTAGTFTAALVVNDGQIDSARATVVVTVAPANRPPSADAGGPYAGIAGQAVRFDATRSDDPDHDALTFRWSFGDGSEATDATPSHAYAREGTFEVSVTVNDGRGGAATATASVTVSPAPLGRGVIAGRVLDDVTGRPLEGVQVRLVSVDGVSSAAAAVVTDALGRFRLASPTGAARVGARRDGYTAGARFVQVVDGRRVDPLDIRLTGLDPRINVLQAAAGGTAVSSGGTARVVVPPGGISADATLRVTEISAQSLIAPLPLGWSPLAGIDIGPDSQLFAAGSVARLSTPAALASTAIVAVWDQTQGAWISGGAGARVGSEVEVPIAHAGQIVIAVPDAAPPAPPGAPAGVALAGVAPRAPPDVQVSLSPSPRILFAQASARSRVTATAVPAGPMPSGTPLGVEAAETFSLSDGGVLRLQPQLRQLSLYQAGSGAALRSTFPVSPSRVFAPFQLRQGVVDLAARLPATPFAPHGRVVTAAGGDVDGSAGERLLIPTGGAAGDVPVDLAAVPVADVLVPAPAGFSVVAVVTVDFHGAALVAPGTLSIPRPAALADGTPLVVARLMEIGSSTRFLLVASALVQGSRVVSSIDPFGDGSVLLPGVLAEGRYAFLAAAGPLGYLSGLVTGSDGGVLRNALVWPQPGIGAASDAQGRYVLAGPVGAANVTITDTLTGDVEHSSGQFVAGAAASTSTAIAAAAPAITSITPADGAVSVPLAASIAVTFSRAIDAATLTAAGARLQSALGSVNGVFTLGPGGLSGTFRPAALLASATAYQFSVGAGLRDTAGRAVATPATVSFTTIDLTPPPPPPAGAVTATIPDASGTVTIAGTQGSAEPGGLVIVRNLRTGALTTLTPRADGSFSGTVNALRSDRLELVLKDAAGNATTTPLAPFSNPDGSVVIGAAGGHLEAGSGVSIDIPAGTLPDGTVVKVAAVPVDQLPLPAPVDYPFLGGVRIDLGGVVPLGELKVSVAAPPTATAADQVVVARAVPFLTGLAWTVEERARFANGKYTTASPPFVGVAAEGTYAFLQPPGSCTSYVSLRYHMVTPVFLLPVGLPFVVPTTDHEQTTIPALCGAQLVIRVFDPDTATALREVSFFAPAARDDISYPTEVLTDDTTPVTVLSINNPTGEAATTLEVRFSKSIDRTSTDNFIVKDSTGAEVAGTFEFLDQASRVVFQPLSPFRQGEQYTLIVAGVKDQSGHAVEAQPITFTPYGPRTISSLRQTAALEAALEKCGPGGCSTSATDVAVIGQTLFVANGVRTADERYRDPADPKRLLAIDITDPFHPVLIGWSATGTNPRALAAVKGASLSTTAGAFNGDLLLVAGGGRVAGGELNGRLEIWDATVCGQRPRPPGSNCLADALKGFRLLSTPAQVSPLPGVPPDSGVPLQIGVLHQRAGVTDVLLAYVLVVPIGIELVNVPQAFNLPTPNQAALGPDGVSPGDFTDLSVLKNRVVGVGVNPVSGQARVDVLTAQLGLIAELPPPAPDGLSGFAGAARVGTVENLVFDLDNDGRVGADEDDDQDEVKGADELFDLALVASGPLSSGCVNISPCGELYVLDLSAHTDLLHPGGPRILARIPLPGAPFSLAVDATDRVAYVELRGQGIATVDLGFLLRTLRGQVAANGLVDANHDGQDDRLVSVFHAGGREHDAVIARIKIDASRGLAIVNGATTGVEIVQVANKANELALDFADEAGSANPDLKKEKEALLQLISGAVAALRGGMPATPRRQALPGLPAGAQISVLEQGSGSCFWRSTFPRHPESTCPAFQAGTSDHDFEVFVEQQYVQPAQVLLNAYVDSKPPPLSRLGDVSLFAMPREPMRDAELMVGTPLYGAGVSDATGDLGMGRQSLLLLWLLEGEYVEGFQGTLPDLRDILALLKQKHGDASDPQCASEHPPAACPVIAGEPSGIPRLEGYEWSLLQEFNLLKTGALLRVRGACRETDAPRPLRAGLSASGLGNDPLKNFNGDDVLGSDCQDELHSVAKAAIRTVFARIVANRDANPLVLDIDPVHQDDLGAYRSNACLEGPYTTANAPYEAVPCTGFEHYIASVAVRAARLGLVFGDADLPQIYQFYCMKVDKCPSAVVENDEDADDFIRAALKFIQDSQNTALTRDAYAETLRLDTKPIGDVPLLTVGPDGGSNGIASICSGLFQRHPALVAPFLRTGDPPLTPITSASPRRVLRLCNYVIVSLKTDGDTNPDAGDSHEVVDPAEAAKHVFLESDRTGALKHRLGVRHYVDWKLQVRALNLGSRPAKVNLSLYEGNGTDLDDYDTLKTIPVSLAAGERRVIATEPVPQQPDPDRKRPLFPLMFNLTRPELAPNSARAVSFFLDPERTVPEASKTDNEASFFYYVLDTTGGGGGPSTPGKPVAPIDNVDPDPLAIQRPRLSFDFTVRGRTTGGFIGGKAISVGLGERVSLKFEIRNLGPEAVKDVQVFVARDPGHPSEVQAVTISGLGAAGASNDHALLSDPVGFTPTDDRNYLLAAHVEGVDAKGNKIGPVYDFASVTGVEDLSAARIRLYDASPLFDRGHPFSRFLANTDNAGHDIPLVGAVTDGDATGGGARIRVEIEGLNPGIGATVSLADPDLPEATDGLGWLEGVVNGQPNVALQTTTVTPDIFHRAVVYYRPPAVFVRDGYRAQDSPRLERSVRLSVVQPGVGGGRKRIVLRRPPVFLVHGLFSATDTWKDFQPLVPSGGLVRGFRPTRGFDGRFDVFAVGRPAMSGSIAEEAAAVREHIRLSLALSLPGYAIGRVDVVGHSMGSLVIRQVVADFVASNAPWGGVKKLPFRKLIALDSPFLGTPLASKIVEIREDPLIKRPELERPKDLLDLVTSFTGDENPQVAVELTYKAKLETCAFMVQSAGVTPAFFARGALDDLATGSQALSRLAQGGIAVPSHHISGSTSPPELGISLTMEALWGTLGYFCNLTPDSTTDNATELFKVGVQAAMLLIPANVRALKPGTSLGVGTKIPWAPVSGKAKTFLSRVGPVAKFARKEAEDGPTPVFTGPNDRVNLSEGQLGGLPVSSEATTSIDGYMDHNSILKTPNVTVSACGDLAARLGPSGLTDLNEDSTPDITCRVVYLLEADPGSRFFFRSNQP